MIYVFCPGGLVTGGTEALHQLAHTLNRDQRRAEMMYLPLHKRFPIPTPFRRYTVDVADSRTSVAGSTVVLAETAAHMIGVMGAANQIHMWWLSVDRFFDVAGRGSDMLLAQAAKRVDKHLYQSEYARLFVQSIIRTPEYVTKGDMAPLGDYLAEEYRRAALRPIVNRHQNIVVYNPAKGAARTQKLLAELDDMSVQAIPIEGMSRNQVRRLLARAKVYIDFGEHPGKDRIPREAAALGCCVVTNRRGAARNTIDVPIDDDYKIDDTRIGWETVAVKKISELLGDFASHQPRFETWRQSISSEQTEFRGQVEAIYGA